MQTQMDEDMEDIDDPYFEPDDFDLDYEFDAARFFDFTRPETNSEAEEAEGWFGTIGSYPPSPFIVKLKWSKDTFTESLKAPSELENGESVNSICNNSSIDMVSEVSQSDKTNKGPSSDYDGSQSFLKDRTNSVTKLLKLRSSTLMKPTASHLAKLNRAHRFSGRSEKSLTKLGEKKVQNTPGLESQASKRQKLEIGYLRKVAHLKHQTLLLHKAPKKVVDGNLVHSRQKVTVPKEPELETAVRAQRRRSKNISESGEQSRVDPRIFKARPLNRKILKAPSLPLHKKSTPQLPQFQVFHLKTSERAMQHSSFNATNEQNFDSVSQNGSISSRRVNSEDYTKQEKCEASHRFKSCVINKKESKFSTDKRLSQNPPVELFNKLSLKSELHCHSVSYRKSHLPDEGLKENVPDSLPQETRRYGGKHSQCGGDLRIPEIRPLSNINRSMDIR